MKYIFTFFLFLPFALVAQTPVKQENSVIFKSTVVIDSLLTADSLVAQKVRAPILQGTASNSNLLQGKDSAYIKENWGSSGSTVYASNGLTKDSDTIKNGGNFNGDIVYTGGYNTSQGFGANGRYLDRSWNFWVGANAPEGMLFIYKDTTVFTADARGIKISQSVDTTKTQPNSVMTEAQVKREIAAAVVSVKNIVDNTSGIAFSVTSPIGDALKINKSGVLSSGEGGRCIDIVRNQSGTGDVSGDIMYVYDNPTSTGTKSGRLLNSFTGSIRTVSLWPRATGTSVPFSFQTFDKPNGTLVEFGMQGRNKVSADTAGVIYDSKPHVAIYRNTDLTISATQNVWYKISGFTTKDADLFTVQGDSIQFQKAGSYMVDMTISFSGLNNEVWELAIFKGASMEEPSQLRYTGTSDVGNMSCPVYMYVTANQWVSFKIRNTTDNDDPTIKRFSARITPVHLTIN